MLDNQQGCVFLPGAVAEGRHIVVGGQRRAVRPDQVGVEFKRPDGAFRVRRPLERGGWLDPPGVAARDLRECLLLQVDDDTPQRDLVRKIIQEHLEDMAHSRLPAIQDVALPVTPQLIVELLSR